MTYFVSGSIAPICCLVPIGRHMKILSKEKAKVVAEINGWSLAKAEGYIDGEICRRRGKSPTNYAQIGIDEYSRGFRAAYYERKDVERESIAPFVNLHGVPAEI